MIISFPFRAISNQSIAAHDRLTIYFHAVLSKDFKFNPDKDLIFVQAGRIIGSWETYPVELSVTRYANPILTPIFMSNIRSRNHWYFHTYSLIGLFFCVDAVNKKEQSRKYFVRRLASSSVCSKLWHMLYNSIVSCILFYAIVCWVGLEGRTTPGKERFLDTALKKGMFDCWTVPRLCGEDGRSEDTHQDQGNPVQLEPPP